MAVHLLSIDNNENELTADLWGMEIKGGREIFDIAFNFGALMDSAQFLHSHQ